MVARDRAWQRWFSSRQIHFTENEVKPNCELFQHYSIFTNHFIFYRDEDREKCSDHLKSSSSEESVRKRRPSGNISINSQLSIFSQSSNATDPESSIEKHCTQPHQVNVSSSIDITDANCGGGQTVTTTNIVIPKKAIVDSNDFHYESVDNVKLKYNYHDEPHSFESSMEFQEDCSHFLEVLETTV